ncbi:hypothetical protein A6K76_05730 [Caryophanon latum]|uniref:Uncharacterized protein n=1 Tax=Caryophanon latum TaxID=33977 RepID=A0A1C0Z1H3_9BACL|nr:hypothetical protein A6K76_05730 [Caryophanon latum]
MANINYTLEETTVSIVYEPYIEYSDEKLEQILLDHGWRLFAVYDNARSYKHDSKPPCTLQPLSIENVKKVLIV